MSTETRFKVSDIYEIDKAPVSCMLKIGQVTLWIPHQKITEESKEQIEKLLKNENARATFSTRGEWLEIILQDDIFQIADGDPGDLQRGCFNVATNFTENREEILKFLQFIKDSAF